MGDIMSAILELNSVSKAFGAITVADALSFRLEEGEALGVIGPNGAGKTSMFNIITGTLPPSSGEIVFGGRPITRLSAQARCRLGVSRSFQIPQPFAAMTVLENLLVAATQGAGANTAEARALAISVLDQTGLLPKANHLAGRLTLLERKRLELARALCTKPKLLLLDEIAGGLTEHECAQLIETIKAVRQQGVSIIWIEHIVHALLSVVDRLIVIDFGRKVAEGDPHETMQSDTVREIYMGIPANG